MFSTKNALAVADVWFLLLSAFRVKFRASANVEFDLWFVVGFRMNFVCRP
jgi:hypothetical protein